MFNGLTNIDLLEVERDVEQDNAFRYEPTAGQADSYFSKLEEADHAEILKRAQGFFEDIREEGRTIMPSNALSYFFEEVSGSLDLTTELKEDITKVFKAISLVSKELKAGNRGEEDESLDDVIMEPAGRVEIDHNFSREDLSLARRIYEQMLAADLRGKRVTPELLKLARNPIAAVENLAAEADDHQAEEAKTTTRKGPKKPDGELLGNDKQVLQQIALYKAMNDGDLQVQADIRAGRMLEDELFQYLAQGFDAEDLHVFKRNIKSLMDDATNSLD